MKCKNCGGELRTLEDGVYFCDYCKSRFVRKVVVAKSSTASNNGSDFVIIGGVLKSYIGNAPDIIIPEGVVSIGQGAFKDNIAIRSAVFPSTLTTIENNAFENCINLLSVSNYENVLYFKDECFKNSGLKEVSIYPKVRMIGRYAFSYMPNLEIVNYNPELDLKLKGTFLRSPKLKTVNMARPRFFPSLNESTAVRNNSANNRPTWGDAFTGTPYIKDIFAKYMDNYKKGICPECGGALKKGLFHARCEKCGIDYKN